MSSLETVQTDRTVPASHARPYAPVLVVAGLLVAALWNLGGPAPWWDEGWTLSVARTLAEHGMYARLLDGQPAPIGLEGAWPIVALAATSFKLLGVGLWQGRLVGALCVPLAAAALAWLAGMLYGWRVAAGALGVVLLLSMHPQTNLLVQGRQLLGEAPMLASLCAGMGCLLATRRRGSHWIIPALTLLGLAFTLKGQTSPFLITGLLAGGAAALWLRRWHMAALLLGGLLARPLAQLAGGLWLQGLGDRLVPAVPISGLDSVIALVLSPPSRLYALVVGLIFGMLTLLGLLFTARRTLAGLRAPAQLAPDAADTLAFEVALLALVASWMAWFILLSVGVLRYLFPAVFVGSIFTALALHSWTSGYDLRGTLRRLAELRREPGRSHERTGLLLLGALVAVGLALSLVTYVRYYILDSDDSAQRVAVFFNTETPPGTRVETYESELHFLLDRPYHYPPDQAHVELNRRSLLGEDAAVDYDPLQSDPDYLVVGVFARNNALYAPVIRSGAFRLVQTVGDYQIYERAR